MNTAQQKTSLTEITKGDTTILKIGRKKFAEITYNENSDYKFTIWFKSGVVLSGFETRQKAIDRTNEMNAKIVTVVNEIFANHKNKNT